jgi:uncharacterized tellurite resistance protein B-like protein
MTTHSTFGETVLRALLLVMLAEDRDSEIERKVVHDLYEWLVEEELSDELLDKEIAAIQSDREIAWASVKELAPDLADHSRAELFKASVVVLMADAELDESELEVVWRLGRALRLGNVDMRHLMREVWREQKQ